MGKRLIYPFCVLLLLCVTLNSCSSDDDADVQSLLYGRWEMAGGTYTISNDGTLEASGMDMEKYPPTGIYKYSLQLDEKTSEEALLSGVLYANDARYPFIIRKKDETPEILELLLFWSSPSGGGCITLTKI